MTEIDHENKENKPVCWADLDDDDLQSVSSTAEYEDHIVQSSPERKSKKENVKSPSPKPKNCNTTFRKPDVNAGSWAERVRGTSNASVEKTIDIKQAETELQKDDSGKQAAILCNFSVKAEEESSGSPPPTAPVSADSTNVVVSTISWARKIMGSWADHVRGRKTSPPPSDEVNEKTKFSEQLQEGETSPEATTTEADVHASAEDTPSKALSSIIPVTAKPTLVKQSIGSWVDHVRGVMPTSVESVLKEDLSNCDGKATPHGTEAADEKPLPQTALVVPCDLPAEDVSRLTENSTECTLPVPSSKKELKSAIDLKLNDEAESSKVKFGEGGTWADRVKGAQRRSLRTTTENQHPVPEVRTSNDKGEEPPSTNTPTNATELSASTSVDTAISSSPRTISSAPTASTVISAEQHPTFAAQKCSWADCVRGPQQDEKESVILWIGSLRVAEKHSKYWIMETFKDHHIIKVVEMGAGYALCQFPKDSATAFIAKYHKAKVDGKKLEVKLSTKYPSIIAA